MALLPLRSAVLTAALLACISVPQAFAQSGDPKQGESKRPAEGAENGKETLKVDELAEAARVVSGPAGNAECVWYGRRVVSLLWRDDMDTAFRHLDLYDRFGCPAAHVQAAFRCLIRQGDSKTQDLNSRVHACWLAPAPPASTGAATPPASGGAKR